MAKNAGAEEKYLKFESSVLGSPGWGTPRSLEQMVEASKQGIDQSVLARLDKLMSGQSPTAVVAAAPVKTPEPAPKAVAQPSTTPSDSGAVSLESLPVAPAEAKAEEAKVVEAKTVVAQRESSKPATRTASATSRRPAPAAEEEAPKKSKPKKVAAAEPAAPPPRPKNDNPLKAAIRSAIFKGGN